MTSHLRRVFTITLVLFWLSGPGRAQQRNPDAESQFAAGRSHLLEGRPKEALESFRRAIKLDGKNPYFYKGLGQAHLKLRQFDEAVIAFRKSLELNPFYVDARNDLGSALILAGKREEGRKELLAAYSDPMNPTPEVTARNIGQAFFEEKRYSEATNWFRTTIDRNRDYPDGYIGLADTLAITERVEEAILVLENAGKILPDDINVLLALGEVYYRAGRFADARTRLVQVAAKDPAGPAGRRASELLKNFPK